MRLLLAACLATVTLAADHDLDGLSDSLEHQLLERFRPQFLIADNDCDALPAEFLPGPHPIVKARNGTLYAQAFPHSPQTIELHWFHLWANDCGRQSHPLDIEHVSALIEKVKGRWQARYWFAAAHQDTLCDASQAARATALDNALEHGPRVWISQGKHASFLSLDACARGCGSDRCQSTHALPRAKLVNLGELDHPLSGAQWIASTRWDFAPKLQTDFSPLTLAKLDVNDGIINVGPGRRPIQAAIAGANTGLDHTGNALATAGDQTERSLALSAEKVGRSLENAKQKTLRWIRERTAR